MTQSTLFDREIPPGREQDAWGTPHYVLDACREALGGRFDLDPASNEAAAVRVDAVRWIGLPADGLAADWACDRLWLNPPFSCRGPWMDRLAYESNVGRVRAWACLIPDPTTDESRALKRASTLACLPNGRINFEDRAGSGSPIPTYVLLGGFDLQEARAKRVLEQFATVYAR